MKKCAWVDNWRKAQLTEERGGCKNYERKNKNTDICLYWWNHDHNHCWLGYMEEHPNRKKRDEETKLEDPSNPGKYHWSSG